MSAPHDFPVIRRRFLLGICLLAAVLRLPGLGSIPPPLNQDEASRGYDAWCLLETGADRWGAPWPLFLKSFGPGDYTAAQSTYITIPFIALLGPTTTAFRLPAALLAMLTIPGLWLWLKRATDEKVATLAVLLLAVSPWHIVITRTAHEAAFVPFFLAWGLAGISSRRVWATVAGGVMLGLAAWDYPAARMIAPLLIVTWLVLNRKSEIGNRQWPAPAGFLIGSAPIWITLLHAPEQVAARASSTSLFTLPISALEMLQRFIVNYAAEFSPAALFITGDDISHVGTPGFGRLLHVEMPFVLVGVYSLFKLAVLRSNSDLSGSTLKTKGSMFLLAWLLLHPLPAAICRFWSPHALRAFTGVIVWPAVTAMGAMCVWNYLGRYVQKSQWTLRTAAAVALTASVAWFANAYYIRWPDRAADAYQENLARAVEFVGPRVCCVDFIHITEFANQPYIHALLFSPIPPQDLVSARDRLVTVPWHERFEHVVRLGKWYFRPIVQGTRDAVGRAAMERFSAEWSKLPPGSRGFVIELPGRGHEGKVLLTLPRRDGTPGLEIRECVIEDTP